MTGSHVKDLAKKLSGDGKACTVSRCLHPQALQVICETHNQDGDHTILAPFCEGGVCRYHKGVANIPREVIRGVLQTAYYAFAAAFNEELVDLPLMAVHWVCGGEIESSEPVDLLNILADQPFAPNDGDLSTDLPFRTRY